jgi:flagellar FliJ protein
MQRAQQKRDQAQSALRRAEDAAERAREQSEQLRHYRGEYEGRWSAQFNQGGTMQIVHCYRSFMQRLDQAVALQSHQAQRAAALQQQARDALLESERRVAAVRKLLERRAAESALAQQRREQKHSDEMSQRMRWRMTSHDEPKFP